MQRIRRSPLIAELKFAGHLLIQNKLVLVGTIVAVSVLIVAAIGPLIVSPLTPIKIDTSNRLMPPRFTHWLGTDDFGRDILSMIILSMSLDVSAMLQIVGAGMFDWSVAWSVLGLHRWKTRRGSDANHRCLLLHTALILALAVASALGHRSQQFDLAIIVVQWPVVHSHTSWASVG